jgi:hypothetical protein
MSGTLMPVDDLVEVVHTILRTDAATSMPIVIARGSPRRPPGVPQTDQL